ncbi:hypothetical protein AJ80_08625 [Polytolypa hystricis UAMH7299]|uniref:RING-type domain-containing protein n=1 Tax=Polytolypa hystricis (strain UAMH7299) TaxID=1447883 RepID=A0A2B7X500_POLH7|nr:hypothetical protein AJ80_08625 [Polytolypa hystricis UAMH7299]
MMSPTGPRPLASAYESPTFGEDSSFHVDLPVGSMSISPCGRDVVLASKEGLHIIDLDSPYSPPRYLPHHTPWEVADVQWSPFAARDSWVVSTSNQKALVWNLALKPWQNPIEHVLHAHSRAITDINFSAHHPDVLATCAVDSFVHCWDLRTPSRPVVSFSDWFAGATQVKWNRQVPHVIASSHDRFLRIWDDRMGAYPVRTIVAHDTKIYGIDWNRIRPEAIATCSLDKTIKFWDYSTEHDVPEKVIHTSFPVWRARNTPFGWGILAMPQRGDSGLHLYSRRHKTEDGVEQEPPLVHSFPGHKGQVKEFVWRPRGTIIDGLDHREFQLVSWGTDKELRLHRVNPDVLREVGYEKGKSFNPSLNLTRTGAVYNTFRDEPKDGDSVRNQTPVHHRSQSVSIGMSSISMPYSRGWTRGGTMGGATGIQGRSALRADMNPISWMRGVKISGWEEETLGDEITHVGEKFTKVAFESVNVGQRKATVSLHGPWGPDGVSIFLKIDMKFPLDYPRASIPSFHVQKTAAVTRQLGVSITTGLKKISEAYVSRKRGCLEGVLRYLLGEHPVEEIVTLVQGEPGETLKSPDVFGGDESSDEDEEVGQFRDQNLGLSSSELLRPVNANVMVPVAKVCGARWANDGRLVCFFPPKKEKVASFLNSMGLNQMTRLSRDDKVFEAFGRLQTGSPGPKCSTGTGTGGGTITDDGASDYSDNSSEASSSSSGSSDILGSLPPQFHAPNTWRSGSLGFYRSRSAENSQKSTTGVATVKSSSDPPNTIHIHNLEDLLPAKRELAKRYQIVGDKPAVCAHNMTVAADSGRQDLAYVWGLVKLMLQNHLPFDLCVAEDVLSMAGRASNGIKCIDSAITMDSDNTQRKKSFTSCRPDKIKWGNHPLGGRWLVPALFEYFERLGDIQMLGMLSCVLHEPESRPELRRASRLHRKSSVLVQKAPLAADYTSPTVDSYDKSQLTSPLASLPREHAISTSHSSACSSGEQWHTDTPPLYSTGTTPPANFRSTSRRSQHHLSSLSGSPDPHVYTRSGSNFGTTLASSLSKSFTFGPSASTSPPSSSSKKKASPVGSLNIAGPGGWAAGGFFGKPASAVPDYLTASTTVTSQTHSQTHSDSESERQSSTKSKAGKRQRVILKNQEEFDHDGQAYVPLLDHKIELLSRAYRAAYAELLSIWNMQVEQREVLRIDGISDGRVDTHRFKHLEKGLSALPRRDSRAVGVPYPVDRDDLGLDIQRHCGTCGFALQISAFAPLTPEKSNRKTQDSAAVAENKCPRCKPARPGPTRLSCVVCDEAISGMFAPCLNCGHIMCLDCHQQWFSIDVTRCKTDKTTKERNIPSCPSGCACRCSDYETLQVPMPPSPKSQAADSRVDIRRLAHRRPQHHRQQTIDYHPRTVAGRLSADSSNQSQTEDASNSEGWPGSSPLASLARGLSTGLNIDLHHRRSFGRKSGTATGSFSGGWPSAKGTLEKVDTM